jgi:hypothetical protein
VSAGVFVRRHLLLAGVALVVVGSASMAVALAGRIKLYEAIRTQQITRGDVDAIAREQARLAQPSVKEQLRRIGMALDTCAGSSACRRKFVRTVNRVIRVTEGGTLQPRGARPLRSPQIPVPRSARPRAPSVTVIRPPVPPAVAVPGPAGKDGAPGKTGPRGPAGTVDSAILDGVDDRLSDVEHGLASLLSRFPGVERVLGVLCRTLRLAC